MNIFTKTFATLSLTAIGILGFQAQPAQAQFRNTVRPYTGQIRQIPAVQTAQFNPNGLITPNLSTQQYLYYQALQSQIVNSYQPWFYGYNPYPPTIYQQNYSTPPAFSYPVYPSYSSYPTYPSYLPTTLPSWPYFTR